MDLLRKKGLLLYFNILKTHKKKLPNELRNLGI